MRSKNLSGIILLFVVMNVYSASDDEYPYSFNRLIDFSLIPAGIVLKAGSDVIEDKISPMSAESINRLDGSGINGFDRSAIHNWSPDFDKMSDYSLNLLLLSPAIALLPDLLDIHEEGKWKNIAQYGLMYMEVYYLTLGFVNMTQAIVQRKRPYLYNNSLSLEEREDLGTKPGAYESFFSGHTAGAFACAVFLSKTVHDRYGTTLLSNAVWASSLSLATFTGYARVKAGRHFKTDVIAGALAGSVIGYMVPQLHKKSSANDITLSFSGNGLILTKTFGK